MGAGSGTGTGVGAGVVEPEVTSVMMRLSMAKLLLPFAVKFTWPVFPGGMWTTKSVCVQPVLELLFTLAYAHPRLPVVLFQLLLSPPMNSTWMGSGVPSDLACTEIA